MSEFSRLREAAGLSVEEAAEAVGYGVSTAYRWERGERDPRPAALITLQALAASRSKTRAFGEPKFRFIDLFAGIGGFRKAFEGIGGNCVFTSEWDSYAQRTYRANFHCEHEVAGDITKVDAASILEHDVLLAGFPCQPFSIAGVSKKSALGRPHGFRCEAQGTLFFDVARIIEQHRPKMFLLENVKNLKSHDRGRTFDVICRTLTEELGYHIDTVVIDAKRFVPQHRERIFIIGVRDSTEFRFDLSQLPAVADGPRMRDILHPEDGSEAAENPFTEGPKAKVAAKYTLTPKLWAYLKAYKKKHEAKGNGFGFGDFGPDDVARTLSHRYYKDGSEILVKRGRGRPRRLTPRECARLMGFDRPGQDPFFIPVSDTRAYMQFGNAVVVPVVEAVARQMLPWITGEAMVQPSLDFFRSEPAEAEVA